MDIGKSQGAMNLPAQGPQTDREQAVNNATKQFQAVYGEKMKEARPVKKQLDKDDFMKIMITEMKHQDPTKPMEAEKMATQMAQLTSVEQLKNVGTAIEKLADKNTATDRLAMSAMIGKSVTVDKGRFSHQKGTLSPVTFDLPEDAQKIKINILDERGETIASRDLEPMKAGANVYNWDGINESGVQVPSGSFVVRVEAENAKGGAIKINPVSKETVIGVSFEGGETNFLVGDQKSPQKVNFRSVTRIEGDAVTQSAAQMNKAAVIDQSKVQARNTPSDGKFELPPELKQRLGMDKPMGPGQNVAKADANPAGVAKAAPTEEPVKAEGFPSGLSE